MTFSFFSCKQKNDHKVFKVFNEGVSLNLSSIQEQSKSNFEKAELLNKQSIDKFRETLKLDSNHFGAKCALPHSLYVNGEFKEAIELFSQAIKINDEFSALYRERGLCKINLGQIQEGKTDLDNAFLLDSTQEIKAITIQDLTDIGTLAFQYGDGFIQQGDYAKGKDYKLFSIGVLMLAFDYDNTRKDIALTISEFANKIGEKEIANKYYKYR